MLIRFVVTDKALNESNNYDLAIEEKITIGRHLESPILLRGDRLSRHHFSLMVVDGALTIENLSSNGTWLNGSLLKAQMSARVKSGDIIELPGYEMQVTLQGTDAPQKTQAEVPAAVQSKTPSAPWKRPLDVTLHILEPREVALLFFAVTSFALIWLFLTH
ncbi:MAG TPA: FHA domain-containing protein [Edaphobacter sp.]|nr:FHA domain-containing protein [Edaphobacter sp.]